MKYYTKKWYKLMQGVGMIDLFQMIPDKEYAQEDIDRLIEEKIENDVKEDREAYDAPPDFLLFDELVNQEFNPEDWLLISDDDTGKRPESKEELLAMLENDRQQAIKEYENREPYNEEETRQEFKEGYLESLKHLETRDEYPDWLYDACDKQLIALGLLPESVYRRLEKESQQNDAEFNRIEKEATIALEKEKIPERINKILDLHDASILKMIEDKNGITLSVYGGLWGNENPYRDILFEKGKVIQQDFLIIPEIEEFEGGVYSSIVFLYDEMYRIDKGYEVHMLLNNGYGVGYLTIECSDIR